MANTAMAQAQAKADLLQLKWMEKMDRMRSEYPDTPEGSLMRMALLAARLEIETQARQAQENAMYSHNLEM